MKGLTLTQPWATLVALEAKGIETRSWSTPYRGPVAIHAAKGLGSVGGAAGLCQFWWCEPFHSVLAEAGYTAELDRDLPRGLIVAVCELDNVIPTSMMQVEDASVAIGFNERAFGDYAPGRFAWSLRNVRALAEPIECRGALGLWDVPAEVAGQIAELIPA